MFSLLLGGQGVGTAYDRVKALLWLRAGSLKMKNQEDKRQCKNKQCSATTCSYLEPCLSPSHLLDILSMRYLRSSGCFRIFDKYFIPTVASSNRWRERAAHRLAAAMSASTVILPPLHESHTTGRTIIEVSINTNMLAGSEGEREVGGRLENR